MNYYHFIVHYFGIYNKKEGMNCTCIAWKRATHLKNKKRAVVKQPSRNFFDSRMVTSRSGSNRSLTNKLTFEKIHLTVRCKNMPFFYHLLILGNNSGKFNIFSFRSFLRRFNQAHYFKRKHQLTIAFTGVSN
jgi:hypothetical protein